MHEVIDDSLLKDFKSRIHISHSSEDESLKNQLLASQKAIARMVGFEDISNPEFKELVLERTRFAYYDQVEYFEDNFHSSIIALGFEKEISNENSV